MSNIVLVEPDTVLGTTYRTALRSAGHTVRLVATAQAAIHAVDSNRPDVIVLELQLAVHDGIEFLHELRSYPDWQSIPVIVHTYMSPRALASVEQALTRDLGVRTCLYKPQTTLTSLVKAVSAVDMQS